MSTITNTTFGVFLQMCKKVDAFCERESRWGETLAELIISKSEEEQIQHLNELLEHQSYGIIWWTITDIFKYTEFESVKKLVPEEYQE